MDMSTFIEIFDIPFYRLWIISNCIYFMSSWGVGYHVYFMLSLWPRALENDYIRVSVVNRFSGYETCEIKPSSLTLFCVLPKHDSRICSQISP